ncbi:MAG: response regulator [Anaerolineae bacterium]|nr:response regulator [Anaerolineae bacterium]
MTPSKILIIEDESIVALDIQSKLESLGYEVIGIVDTGDDALELVGREKAHLAIMDIQLRGSLDGIATAHLLRASHDIPTVFLTAYADAATLQRAKIAEPLGYLVKPFEERDLYSAVEIALYRQAMDRSLRQVSDQLHQVIASVPEGLALLDADHRVLLLNDRCRDYLTLLAKVSAGDVVECLGDTPISALLESSAGETWREIKVAEPTPRIFEVIATPANSEQAVEDGSQPNLTLVIRDVTEARKIEERIQIQDRLASMGQLAAGIAHDFNNILTSIMLLPYAIQKLEPHLSARSRDCLETITSEAKRGSQLIRQILDFSRASLVEAQVFDLVPLLKEQAKMLRRVFPDNIHLMLTLPGDQRLMNGDPSRILQLLMNLAVNARDAMPDGGELRIELDRVSGAVAGVGGSLVKPEWNRIRFTDHGVGIQPETLPHIFEPFFTTKPTGTGLGLAQVYAITEQHGGVIQVESTPGDGATFSVFFPAWSTAPVESVVSGTGTPEAASYEPSSRVLFVEDNEEVRASIQHILELMGFDVIPAPDGREALSLFEQQSARFDLILTDLAMPVMGGLELCRELRRRGAATPIVVMTGHAPDASLSELAELGVADTLIKPLEAQALTDSLRRAMQKSPSQS